MKTQTCELSPEQNLSFIMRSMQNVSEYSAFLNSLGERWEILTLLGQMSGTGTDMTKTKEGFATLSSKLLNNLAKETIKKLSSEINSKAQVAVDVLIRNLFERTADIGFLATDDDVRHYLVERVRLGDGDESVKKLKGWLVERFGEYTLKYSVYSDIVLSDTEGNVLVRLDEKIKVAHSNDEFLREAMNTTKEYVESLGKSELLPNHNNALVYSYRVVDADDASKILGVLSLCFRFEDEMERIFTKLNDGSEWLVLTVLDAEGVVIATSDKYQVPCGAKLQKAVNEAYKVTKFAGRNYIAKTCATGGYQGFYGLGWYGHAMIPIEHAFESAQNNMLDKVDGTVLSAVMSNPTLFSNDLREIPVQADTIQKELERTVWNGNVKQSSTKKGQNATFSKALLWEISNTGAKTKEVFESSIGNLHETVVSSILGDAMFQASLAIDIMDRNLYERANDCRWWALTTTFREILAKDTVSDVDTAKMEDILAYINGLYTVYTNIIVVDKSARVVAASKASNSLKGKNIGEEYVRQVLSVKDTGKYGVSPFAKTFLYDGLETYVYGASILSPSFGDVVGGIFIVFDSQPQFEAMLHDALPKDDKGEVLHGSFGIFADKHKSIISSTNPKYEVGKTLPLDDEFFSCSGERGFSNIVKFDNDYYAVGVRCSDGYREFKSESDSYKNDVAALIFIHLGAANAALVQAAAPKRHRTSIATARNESENTVEIATFYIGGKWLGINSELVAEAVSIKGLTTVPGSNKMLLGRTNYHSRTIDVISLREELGLPSCELGEDAQIVVVKQKSIDEKADRHYGVVVDELGEIPEVPTSRIDMLDSIVGGSDLLGEAIVKPEEGQRDMEMLVVLDPQRILNQLVKRS